MTDAEKELLKKQIKLIRAKGWSVQNDKNRTRLQVRENGKVQRTNLEIDFNSDNFNKIINRIKEISNVYESCGDDLKEAATKTSGNNNKSKDKWHSIIIAFQKHREGRVNQTTWDNKYARIIGPAIEFIRTGKATNGREVLRKALNEGKKNGTGWEHGSRQRIILRQSLSAFLVYAVEHHDQDSKWYPPRKDDSEVTAKKRDGYAMHDHQIIRLLEVLRESEYGRNWIFAVKLMAVYGCRPEDLRYLHIRKGDNGAELWSGYEKSAGGTRGQRTEARLLLPLPIKQADGTFMDWDKASDESTLLYEICEALKDGKSITESGLLPSLREPGRAGDALSDVLKRQPQLSVWNEIRKEAESEGQQLVPYSLRHRFSREGHERGVEDLTLCSLMGHTPSVHWKNYARFKVRGVPEKVAKANREAIKSAA